MLLRPHNTRMASFGESIWVVCLVSYRLFSLGVCTAYFWALAPGNC